MKTESNQSLRARFQFFSHIMAALTIVVGALVMVGWILDIAVLKSVLPNLVSMKVNTALCFALSGTALWLRVEERADENTRRARRALAAGLAAIAMAIGFATLLEHRFGWNFGIDELLLRDNDAGSAAPGRMAPATALGFVLIGSALLLWNVKFGLRIGQWMALLVFLVACQGLLGYCYGVKALYQVEIYSSMALHTAVTFLALSAGILCAHPHHGLMRPLTGGGIGSLMTRRLLPLTIIMPLFLGWIRLEIGRHQIFELAFGTAWLAFFNALFVGALVWGSGAFLNRLGDQREETERALRESEELFSKAFHLSVDYVYIARISDDIILRANDAVCRLLCLPLEEIIGKPIQDLGKLLSTEEFMDYRHRLQQHGEVRNYESVMRLYDGRLMPFNLSSRLITLHDEVCVLAVFHDLTEREQTEILLRSSERKWKDLAESMSQLVWTCNAQGDLEYLSKQWYDYTGLVADDSLNQLWLKVIRPEDFDFLLARWTHSLKTGEIFEVEHQIRRADGEFRWFQVTAVPTRNAEGEIVKWYGSNTDIHQTKLAQAENERFAAIIESSADAIFSKTLDHVIESWNPGAQKLMGYSAQEIIGQPMSRIIAPEVEIDVPKLIAHIARTREVEIVESTYLHKDGRRVPASITVSPIVDANGKVTGTASIARDISERLKSQAELQRAKDELEERVTQRTTQLEERSSQLEERTSQLEERSAQLEQTNEQLQSAKEDADAANLAKSEFLSRMSHELRTPLNAILGFGQLLEIGRRLNERDAESVEHILKSGRHLLALINEVLDIARIEAGHLSLSPEPIHVTQLVVEVLNIVQPLATPRSIQLINRVEAEDERYVMADQQRCRQILLNLLSNAIKYNRDGGWVTVYYSGTNGVLRLNVGDSGPGLSKVEQGKLFVPFERLGAEHSQIEGTGIGLALCKRLVEAMKGDIGVESAPGQGSTFWVEFPAVKSQAAQLAKTVEEHGTAARAPASKVRRSVLYIEDNLSNLKLIQSILTDRPEIELLSAMQGSIGLELAMLHRPDLILLDVHLPDISGEVVLRRLKAEPTTRAIPVVILSADAMPRQIANLSAAGASCYLTKPIDLHAFLEALDSSLGEVGN